MGYLFNYFFKNIEDKQGDTLPFSRWDILLASIVAITLMVAMAYSVEFTSGWTTKRSSFIGMALLFALLTATNRRLVFGTAFALIALRSAIGLIGNPHLSLIGLLTLSAMLSWQLLKNL